MHWTQLHAQMRMQQHITKSKWLALIPPRYALSNQCPTNTLTTEQAIDSPMPEILRSLVVFCTRIPVPAVKCKCIRACRGCTRRQCCGSLIGDAGFSFWIYFILKIFFFSFLFLYEVGDRYNRRCWCRWYTSVYSVLNWAQHGNPTQFPQVCTLYTHHQSNPPTHTHTRI